ncbi:MAG: flagellar hook-length control protein FliK [Aquabacterium sp.]|nr:flagellar hook-length control protein FliK [Aquabacterium sp.]
MATPIQSKSNPLSGTTSTAAFSDLASKLNATSGGADSQNQKLAFSRWMEQHALTPQDKPPQAQASKSLQAPDAAGPDAAASKAANQPASASRASDQALARMRQQSVAASKQIEHSAADAPPRSPEKITRAKPEASTAKPARKDATAKAEPTDKADADLDKAKGDKDELDVVAFSTANGEGAAVVRELTPPPTIQPGDAAGMMAWLASLAHGDAKQGQTATTSQLQGDQNEQGASTGQIAEGQSSDAALLAKSTDSAGKGSITLDNPLWQNVSVSAAVQVDAMMARAGKSSEGAAATDPLAGLTSADALKGAGLASLQNTGAQSVRHESATLATPLASPDFAQALAEKVSMWVSSAKTGGPMTAELHLNPAEMGPINVKISLDGQSAHVDFAAAAIETRQAIEASMPLLSRALDDVGLSMTGGGVSSQTSQQAFNQSFGQPDKGLGRGQGVAGMADEGEDIGLSGMRAVAPPRPGRAGGLDMYA